MLAAATSHRKHPGRLPDTALIQTSRSERQEALELVGKASARRELSRYGWVMGGRALGWVTDRSVTRDGLRGRGWTVDDLADETLVLPYATFDSLTEARAKATHDLPAGTAVRWSSDGGVRVGGFVVGDDRLGPPIGDRFPAFVLWPDLTEGVVCSVPELSAALRGRLDAMCDSALAAGVLVSEVDAGRLSAEHGLDELETTGRLTNECCGPLYRAYCAARVQPEVLVLWDGFQSGWTRSDEREPDDSVHPVHPRHQGAFLRCWRDGLRAGINARNAHQD